MNCFIKINSKNKAKQDIDKLMLAMGFKDLAISGFGNKSIETFVRKSLSMISLLCRLHKGDFLVIQYPFKKFYTLQCRIAKLKGAHVITLIHDLGSFRRSKLTPRQEMKRLSHTDYIIAHNEEMKSWIETQALANLPKTEGHNFFYHRIGCLEIFDYLSEVEPVIKECSPQHNRIVYAGGLGLRKNAFLYQAGNAIASCHIDVYGSGDLDTALFQENITYHGRISSDDFIRTITGDWGLVWDGDSIDNCSGIWGEYLRYNNPHKASFYIRSGLPIIVWEKSAMAPFVLKEGIGIVVKTLNDIAPTIEQLDENRYKEIRNNIINISNKLQEGFYFNKAILQAIDAIKQQF